MHSNNTICLLLGNPVSAMQGRYVLHMPTWQCMALQGVNADPSITMREAFVKVLVKERDAIG